MTRAGYDLKRLCVMVPVAVLGLVLHARPAIAQGLEEEKVLPVFDAQRMWALGMLETGNDDTYKGGAGEISRYQIRPAVWRTYTSSRKYRTPEISMQVAQLHWDWLASTFREKAGRSPGDFDMYVMWNAGYQYYSQKHFRSQNIAPVVRDRARRYVNLVHFKNQELLYAVGLTAPYLVMAMP